MKLRALPRSMGRMSEDLLRLLANLIRYGTVAAVVGKRVQVQTGGVITKPLPWATGRAGDTTTWSPPSKGEQVVIFSPNGDLAAGFVLPALYSDDHPEPAGASLDSHIVTFHDGAAVHYDAVTHQLTVTLPAGGALHLDAPAGITVTGDVTIVGALHATQTIASDGDVTAGPISLSKHPHDKVEPGNGISGMPQP